jgi:hypothetical protein
MPSPVYPDGADPASYRGLSVIYEYTNADGDLRRFNCGQAAACTFLTHHGSFPADPDPELAHAVMTAVEADHPPDNAGGWFGTSRRRVERVCRTHGIELEEVEGETELRERLADGHLTAVPRILSAWPPRSSKSPTSARPTAPSKPSAASR